MPDGARLRVDVWSDFLCPWCYVASPRVRWLDADDRVEVVRLPYQLHPSIPVAGRLTADVYGRGDRERAEAALRGFAEMCEAEGLPWRVPTKVPNTQMVLAIDDWLRERDPDVHRRFHDLVFAALWAEDRDLTSSAVVAELVEAAGGPVDDALVAGSGEGAHARLADLRQSANEVGVGGTPSFVFGQLVVPGMQAEEWFERIVTKMTAADT
ncbi:MAG: DsbA family protein [Actinomycetota bacterium]